MFDLTFSILISEDDRKIENVKSNILTVFTFYYFIILPAKCTYIRRKVFLAEFDPDGGNPIPTATAYLKLTPEQCPVADISQLSKEYLNIEADLVIVDKNGFEILYNSTTRGRNVSNYITQL